MNCFYLKNRCQTGLLSTLQTDEEHLGKGYGKLVVKAISKQIADKYQHNICAGIVDENEASKAVFSKLGFKQAAEKVYWLYTTSRVEKDE